MRTRSRKYARAAAAAVTALLVACGGPAVGPEESLRAWVAKGVAAAEAKERRELVAMIAPSYADARGNGRDDIENLLRLYIMRQNRIALLTTIDEITIYDDTAARLDLTVGMASTNDRALGFSADAYRFQFEVERDDDDWQLISARWGELGQELR
ncbi:MAG TPA: hypothetical protein VIS31_12695 [Woeseiaceae bacterium]